MFKHLLFTSLLAFLATSCGGGHITTTPVVRNAPSASLGAPTRRNAPTNQTRAQNLAVLDWGRTATNTGFYVDLPSAYPIINHSSYLIDKYNNVGWAYLEALSEGDFSIQPYSSRLLVKENNITSVSDFKNGLSGCYIYYQTSATSNAYDEAHEEGYYDGYEEGHSDGYVYGYGEGFDEGREIGFSTGYEYGFEEGEATGQRIYPNGQYTGLTIFSRRFYVQQLAIAILRGDIQHPADGYLYMDDTNANYTIYIKWTWDETNKKTTFQDYGNMVIGELYWGDVSFADWSTSWFGYYDAELHYFTSNRNYASVGVLETSFYPEVYICSTFSGDPNLYFFGSGNAYQLGFADGQTYTIQASETYNNVFTIFTPAFRAVANFFNLNIGPFKIWYFFAIPLIVSLLILVLRLVKH